MATQLATIQMKRGNADEWSNTKGILAEGEWGLNTTTGEVKMGDGTSLWSDLPVTLLADAGGQLPDVVRGALAKNLSDTGTAMNEALLAATASMRGAVVAQMSPDRSAEANVAAFDDAYSAARAKGYAVKIPATPGGQILVNAALNVSKDSFGRGGVVVFSDGYCAIRQTTKPETIFNVTAPRSIVDGFDVYGDGLDMTGMGSPINYARYVGVWLNGGSDGSEARNIIGHGLHRAVRVDPDPTTTASPTDVPNLTSVTVRNVESDQCWCAVSAVGFDSLTMSGVRGTYKKAFASDGTDTGQPPHGIYVIDRTSSTPPRRNGALTTADCLMRDSGSGGADPTVGAAAYAIKGVRQWTYDRMGAINCEGLFDLISIAQTTPGTAWSIDDVYPLTGARGSIAIKDSAGSRVRATIVAKTGDFGRLVYVESTATDCVLELDLTVAPTTARSAAGTGVVRVSGKRNEVRARLQNTGTPMRTAIEVQSTSAAGNRIIDPRATAGFRYGVEIRQGDGAYVEYDSTQLIGDPAAGGSPSPVLISSGATGTAFWDKVTQWTGGKGPVNPVNPDPKYGYSDTFARSDATDPGPTTEDGQPYTVTNNGTWNIENGLLRNSYSPSAGSILSPAGGKADGVISFKVGSVGDANGYYLLRGDTLVTGGAAYPNWLRLNLRTSSTDLRPVVASRVNGGSTTNIGVAPNGVKLNDGDTVTITMSGQNVSVAVNGTTIITATDTIHTARTLQGPWAAAGGTTLSYDTIGFAPAA